MAMIMNRLISLLAGVSVLFIQVPAIADERSDGPGKAAEHFYAGYLTLVSAEKDTTSWVAKSSFVTKNFKKSYAKQMHAESVEVDPVLQAQDTPTSPFKAIKSTIDGTGTKATVILTAKYSDETQKLTVNMVRMDNVWKLDAVDAAK